MLAGVGTDRNGGRLGDATGVGILFILCAGLSFSFIDIGVRSLAGEYHVAQVVWARYAVQMLLAPLVIVRGIHERLDPRVIAHTRNLKLQVGRSLFLLAASVSSVTALQFIPLAETNAIGKVGPLFVTTLAIPLLGEVVGKRRWTAVVIGFVGALVIIRPGFGGPHWAMFLPLFAALFFALYQIATRMLSNRDSPATTFFYTGLVGFVAASLVVPFVWRTPSLGDAVVMASLGLLASLGHFLLIQAFRRAPASTLAPFGYVSLLWATLAGYVFFDHFPDIPTIVGALIIAASGVYVFYREGIVARRA